MDKLPLSHNFLQDIMCGQLFWEYLLECGRLTYRNRSNQKEASFCAYGDINSYNLTLPLLEYRGMCLGGVASNGVNYSEEGYGFWNPEGADKLVGVHFHPYNTDNIPSKNDIRTALTSTSNTPDLDDLDDLDNQDDLTLRCISHTMVIGVKKGKTIGLLCLQPTRINHMISARILAEEIYEVVIAPLRGSPYDVRLEKAVEGLNKISLKGNIGFLAASLSFPITGFQIYQEELEKVSKFTMLYEVVEPDKSYEIDDYLV